MYINDLTHIHIIRQALYILLIVVINKIITGFQQEKRYI